MPVGESASPLPGTNAFTPVFGSRSDWCRCQPEDITFGSFGRHMKVA